MTTRSHSRTVVFHHPFELEGVDRILPPGDYRVVTDEELIEQLSFPAYRRVATMILAAIDPRDLEAAQDRDRAMDRPTPANADRPGDTR